MSQHHTQRDFLRVKILRDHLQQIAMSRRAHTHDLADGLSYASAISLIDDTDIFTDGAAPDDDSDDDVTRCLPGALSDTDLQRCAPRVSSSIGNELQAELCGGLKRTLLSLSSFWSEPDDASETSQLDTAMHLPEQLRARRDAVTDLRSDLRARHGRVQKLVQDINEIHPRLQSELSDAVTDIPPLVMSARAAQGDVLAMTIETSLLKLSLVRAHAFRSIYGHTSPVSQTATMDRAIHAVATHIQREEDAQLQEQDALDSQIEQYSRMLQTVDGHGGGFAQVVQDMSRIQQEMDECRRDLRRLGWTGD